MGGHQMFSDTTRTYTTRYDGVESTAPATARDIKECGCYKTSHSEYRDRVWVTYTNDITTYHLCIEHMQEHQQHMKVCQENVEKERKEDKEREKIWVDRCIRAKSAVKKEQQMLVKIMQELKLHRLRGLKNVVELYSWSCSFHRGDIGMRFTDRHSQFCPVKEDPIDPMVQKNRDCSCRPILPVFTFKYVRKGGKYTFHKIYP